MSDATHTQSRTALMLLAFGVVFGDIGTSPLYAVKATFDPVHGIPLTQENILGGLSTMFWTLMIVVSLKYVMLIMRADNRGEGGIMALLALATASIKQHPHWRGPLLLAGAIGAALFYGDAVLTPAISVLSAVEGLEVGTSVLHDFIVPIALGALVALFLLQRSGTATIGRLFGPVMLLWFLSLAAAGIYGIADNPTVLEALYPWHAFRFFGGHVLASFVVLGSVVLCVTGAEALYADMGHFGREPIQLAWFWVVLPALVLNYFGQGALLIADPETVAHPFYLLVPERLLYPLIALATAATLIASQATISGAYSITRQAIQLGFLPRMNVVHTSSSTSGQIYVPVVNWILLAGVACAVLAFRSSSELTSAYGVAVTATMLVDTLLAFFVIRYGWGYPLWFCLVSTGFFLAVDAAFFGATLLKIADGGWFPLALGIAALTLMTTWRQGREILLKRLRVSTVQLEPFLQALSMDEPQRVSGTAVFLTATPEVVPHALLHNLSHNKVLHERVVMLTVTVTDAASLPPEKRLSVQELSNECYRVTLSFGFADQPDVWNALNELGPAAGLEFNLMKTSFFLSRETVIPVAGIEGGMALWRERLFATMARNAGSAVDYFNIPTNRVIELGTQVQI